MSDWTTYLGRSRRWIESLAWVGAAAFVVMVLATSAALAMWFDRRAGEGNADTIMLDLPPMPAVEAVAEDPGPAPESSAAAPDAPDAPDLDDQPPTPETAAEDVPEFDQPDLPELDEVAEQMPDTTPPPPEPEPEPVKKAEVEQPKPQKPARQKSKPKEAKKAEKTEVAAGRKSTASAAANSGSASARGNNATADAMTRWKSKVQGIVAGHMKRGNYRGSGKPRLVLSVSGSGAITGVSMQGTSGDASVDAKIVSRGQALRIPAPPDGNATTVIVPLRIKG